MGDNKGLKFLRLNPREVEDAVREERRKWRVFRLQQVREQARIEAERVRGSVRKTQAQMVQTLEQEALKKWQKDKENKVQQLQNEYDSCFRAFGQAHEEAKQQPDAVEVLAENMKINKQKAARRGREARKAYEEENAQKHSDKIMLLQRRQVALRKEKLRASRVAQLPTPEAIKKKKVTIPEPVPSVQLYEHGTLTTTSYVPKNIVVEKEIISTKPSAHQLAEVEEMARTSTKEAKRMDAEDIERKREERGRAALHRERLHRNYKHLIDQLDQAQMDHQLSAFMRGADSSMYETEESRLQKSAHQQLNMEAAAERILKEKLPMVSGDDSQCKEAVAEDSDLKEISSDSKVDTPPETLSARERQFSDLRDAIKKTRQHLMQNIYDSRDSYAEQDLVSPGISETPCKPELKQTRTARQTQSVHDQNLLGVQSQDTSADQQEEKQGESSSSTEQGTSHSIHVDDTGAPEIRPPGVRGDIHFSETVPVHLMPKGRSYRELPDHLISRDRDHRELPIQDSFSAQSSSEGTVLPASSDDIEIRIRLSSDSCVTSVETPLPENQLIRPVVPVQGNKVSEQYPAENLYSTGESTDYLNLPASFLQDKRNLVYTDNLKKIQEQRQNIQRLLDGRGVAINREKISPLTYMQELNTEGSGKRPARKREKFEQKKREILHQYIRKLLNLKEDEMMHISASTVEGSGITVSSLNALLDPLNKNGDSSIFSSSSCLTDTPSTVISSPIYPDIDEVPTKLSSSSEYFVDPNILPSIPRVHTQYDPAAYINTSIEKDGSSSTHPEFDSGVILPHHVYNQNSCASTKNDVNYTDLPSRMPKFSLDLQNMPAQNSVRFAPVEASCSTASNKSDGNSSSTNFQRELQILHQLQTLQRLKQNLLLKKNNLMKECEESSSLQDYKNEITDFQRPRSKLQEEVTKVVPKKTKEHDIDHFGSDLAEEESSSNLGTTLDSGETNIYQQMKFAEVSQLQSRSNSLWRNVPHESDADTSEDKFVTLKPESSRRSAFCSSVSSGPRKIFNDQSFTGTEFMHLLPEATLHSEKIQSNYQTPSSMNGTNFTSRIPKKVVNLEGVSVTVASHNGDSVQEIHKRDTDIHSSNQFNRADQKVDSNKAKSVSPGIEESQPSVLERYPSYDTNADQAVTSLVDVPSDVPEGGSSCSLAVIQQANADRVESSKSVVIPVSSQRSSCESINSIPDMGEILQRFGLTWAESMIRKMDKTEENSSSGN